MAALDEVRKKMNVRNRRFKGNQDFYSLQRMLIDSYAITGHPFYNWAIDGWEEERYMIHYDQEIIGKREWEQNIQVWELETESGYEIVGAVDYQDGYVQFQIHPDYHILDNELFEWAEKHHLAQSSDPLPGGVKPELRTEACGHTDWEKTMLARGYEKQGVDNNYRKWSMSKPIPEVALPGGYLIRPVDYADDSDLEKRVEIFHDLFPDRHKISKEKLRFLENKASTYFSELDLIIATPDDSFAGVCTGWYDRASQIGFLDPVGTRPEYRKQGFARALVYECLRKLKTMGAEEAYLRNSESNQSAYRFYDSIGMDIFDRQYLWVKKYQAVIN